MNSKWSQAEAEAKQRTSDRSNAALKQRVRDLERELAVAARTADLQRATAAIRVRRQQPRKRGKRDRVRVVFADIHGYKMAHDAVGALLGDIKALAPDEIIIGGDLVDCGGFLAQHHTLGYVAETDYTYEEDIAAANGFLDALQEAAPHAQIEVLEGNHENRVERWVITQTLRNPADSRFLRKLLAPEILLQLQHRGIPYFQRHVTHGDCRQPGFIRKGKCFFVHEIAGGANAASKALSDVAGNICFFHTHKANTVIGDRPGVGQIGAWNPGCLCEKRPMWMHTKPNDWTHGYAVQLVAASGNFLHINVPIVDGQSLLTNLTTR